MTKTQILDVIDGVILQAVGQGVPPVPKIVGARFARILCPGSDELDKAATAAQIELFTQERLEFLRRCAWMERSFGV
jgi:hypothetical protein